MYVQGDNGDLGIFARDRDTGVLTFQQIQSFDDAATNVTVKSVELVGFEFSQLYESGSTDLGDSFRRDLAFAVINESGGWRGDEWIVRAYQRDAETGVFAPLDRADYPSIPATEIAFPGAAKASGINDIQRLLVAVDTNDVLEINGFPAAGFLGPIAQFLDTTYDFGDITAIDTTNANSSPRFHVIASDDDKVTSFTIGKNSDGRDALVLTEQVVNGVDGVIGLDGPTDVAMSSGGDFMYITSRNGAVAVFERNAANDAAQFVQVVQDDVAGFGGLPNPVSVVPLGESAVVATAGSPQTQATLVKLDAQPIVGGTLGAA